MESQDHSKEQERNPGAAPAVTLQLPSPTASYPYGGTVPLWCSLHRRWLPPGRPLFYNRGTEFWLLVR